LQTADTTALQLISLRTNYMHNSWLANMPQLRKGRHALNPLHIHPRDAQQRGLGDGQCVTVYSDSGEIETELLFDTNLREGVVAMSHGYGQRFAPALSLASTLPGANPNRLLPSGAGSYEKLSGMSWMNGVRIEVKAAPK
jgi:anaerobic selenocysteine-containing dehydrogenase